MKIYQQRQQRLTRSVQKCPRFAGDLHIARRALWCGALALLLLSGLACSDHGDASGAECAAEVSCGGDLSGTWQIDSECLSIDSPFQQAECQSAIKDVSVAVHGTVAYALSTDSDSGAEADASASAAANGGTQDAELSYAFQATESYSTPCLEALGFEGPSADACHGLELLWAGAIAVSCAPHGSSCDCDFSDQEHASDSESFTFGGGQIVLSDSSRVDYCRSGNRLVESASTGSSRAVVTLHLQH